MQDKTEQQTKTKDTSKQVEFDGFKKDILTKVKEVLGK